MKSLLTPKNDFVFKKLFSSNVEILADLINCVLKTPENSRIISVKVINSDIPPDEIEKKFIILDIRALDETGREYDIEMQVRKYENYAKRSLYYLCKMYGGQLLAGDDYALLHPVIGIHFQDYEQFPGHPEFHYRFRIADIRYPELSLNEDLILHIFELPGIERRIGDHKKESVMEWLYFFNHAHEEGDKTMRENYTNPAVKKAFNVLEALSADEKTRELAERREKALKDERMFLNEAKRKGWEEGIEKGREEGIEKGKKEKRLEMVKKMLSIGMPVEDISGISGLKIEEIEEIVRAGDR